MKYLNKTFSVPVEMSEEQYNKIFKNRKYKGKSLARQLVEAHIDKGMGGYDPELDIHWELSC